MRDIAHNIETGFPARGMMPYGGGPALTQDQVRQLASYVLSRQDTHPPNPKPTEPDRDTHCE